MTFQFTDPLRRDMVVRDIRNRHPETQEVFERFGVRTSCWDCSLTEVAHRSGVRLEELMGALEEAVTRRHSLDRQTREES